MRYVFPVVKVSSEKTGTCIHCGKKRTRRTTETATENPWNVDENGLPRTRAEIQRYLYDTKIAAWKKRPIICTSCAEGTLWMVRFRAGDWSVIRFHDHAAIGNHLWQPKYDSGHVIVYALTEDDARTEGIQQLSAIMQGGDA